MRELVSDGTRADIVGVWDIEPRMHLCHKVNADVASCGVLKVLTTARVPCCS